MNFDTKYLIRWGIPGWIMVLTLFPYFFFTYYQELEKLPKSTATDVLALGAVLTFLGVPLGYVLNQVHHSIFWVLWKSKNGEWESYFKNEIMVDEKHFQISEFKKERYRYLLSKKHELGGVATSLTISCIVIFFMNLSVNDDIMWAWIYFVIVFPLTCLLWASRNYTSENVKYYFDEYLLKNESEKNEIV